MGRETNSPIALDVELDVNNFHDGALRLLRLIRPTWENDVALKVFTNGITNKMLGYYNKSDKSDMVLIRINGNKTEIFLDRQNEVKSFLALHSAGCAPTLYCTFNNGLCYEYIPGSTLTRDEVRCPKVFRLVAKEMVKLHKVVPSHEVGKEPVCFSLCRKFLHLRFADDAPEGKGLEDYHGPSENELKNELDYLESQLSKFDSPLVYCHNDLLLNNVIYNKEKGSVHFIDYEYTGMNYQAFDIGNHFCEFAGVDDVDYSFYPDRELQLAWLREYLKHWNDESFDSVTDNQVEELYKQVNKFALAAHFLWSTWALVQAKYSSIDFDYLKYAQDRLDEYFKRKEEFLSL